MRRDRKLLLVLAAVFFVPVMISWAWYLNVDEFRPTSSVAKGTLVEPVRTLGAFSLPRVGGGAPVTDESTNGQWTLVYIGGADCGETCRDRLYGMRQVHAALGRDATRLKRVYVVVDAEVPADPDWLAREHRDLVVAHTGSDDPWLRWFEFDGTAPQRSGGIFLVDPLGNLMMRYGADAPHRDLLDDLKRLFRVSRIG